METSVIIASPWLGFEMGTFWNWIKHAPAMLANLLSFNIFVSKLHFICITPKHFCDTFHYQDYVNKECVSCVYLQEAIFNNTTAHVRVLKISII
jgi:hypothetical protein